MSVKGLDDLRAIDNGSHPNVCRRCGNSATAQLVTQIRERGANPKSIWTRSGIACEACAMEFYEWVEAFFAPGSGR